VYFSQQEEHDATRDERTVSLEIFVHISLLCTLLTLPFIALLLREFARRGMRIDPAGCGT
jgi:hypothetical protein